MPRRPRRRPITPPMGYTGKYMKVYYPPSTVKGELRLGVTYTLWIPDGVKTLRGIIVHQHGAGTTPQAKP